MEVMLIKKHLKTTKRVFTPGQMYVIYNDWKREIIMLLKKNNIKNAVSFCHLNNFIKPLKASDTDTDVKSILMPWTGGIGDLIALTSVMRLFPDANYSVYALENKMDLFNWMPFKIVRHNFDDPIFNKPEDLGTWRYFSSQGTVDGGDNRYWLKVFYDLIDKQDAGNIRPVLRPYDLTGIDEMQCKSLLIVNKASCMMRTMPLTDVVKALPRGHGYKLFAYKNNEPDVTGVTYLKSENLNDFLSQLFVASQVISVDTSAIHFREALDKPAIGLFNSFTAESRTRDYLHAKCFDLKSYCEYQPCFTHDINNVHHCRAGKPDDFAAPCFNSIGNDCLVPQMEAIFERIL